MTTPAPSQNRSSLWLRLATALWFAPPALLWFIDFSRGRYITYRLYRISFWRLVQQQALYANHPAEKVDQFVYGPLFSALMAPFALLPDVLGGLLWNLAMAGVLYVALARLRLSRERRVQVLLLCSLDLWSATWSNQYNPAVAGLLLLGFADVEEGRDFRAPLWTLIGAFTKIYGGIGLLFFLFSRNKKAFVAGCIAWSALLFVLPMALSSPGYVVSSYLEWPAALAARTAVNVVGFPSQNISIAGFVRRVSGLPLSNTAALVAGALLVLAPLLRVSQWRNPVFRLLTAASILMFLVLFSVGAEASTYIVAAVGAALWLVHQEHPFRGRNLALVVALVVASLAPTDLLTLPVRLVTNHYALKVIPYAIVWFLLSWDLLRRDFTPASGEIVQPAGLFR